MFSQDYVTVVRDLVRAANDRDYGRILSMIADDAVLESPGTGRTIQGREAKEWFERRDRAFPDWKVEPVDIFGSGDRVCAEVIFRGTHTGLLEFPSGGGPVQPTGRHVELRVCVVYEFRNGKIVRGRGYFDRAALLEQLGLMPQQKAA